MIKIRFKYSSSNAWRCLSGISFDRLGLRLNTPFYRTSVLVVASLGSVFSLSLWASHPSSLIEKKSVESATPQQTSVTAVSCHGLILGQKEPGWEHTAITGAGQIDTRAHETFGAFLEDGGATFRFYLPNAKHVEVLLYDSTQGTFVSEAATAHANGVWEAEVAGVVEKTKYLLRVTASDGRVYNRIDPFSLYVEPLSYTHAKGPKTQWVSVIWPRTQMKRAVAPLHYSGVPKLVEIHPSTYVQGQPNINLVELVEKHLIPDLKAVGATHAAFMPLQHRHDTAQWWGAYKPGAMFSPHSQHGTPDDYRKAFQLLRAAGIGVILDFVSGHGDTEDETGLADIDGTDLYYYHSREHGYHEAFKSRLYDFTRPHVLSYLLSNARFWFDYYGVDGLRVDCLEIIFFHPPRPGHYRDVKPGGREYLSMLTAVGHSANPNALMIAEDSTSDHVVTKPRNAEMGGLGFDFRWNFAGQWAAMEAMKNAMKGTPGLFPLLHPIREQDSLGPTLNMIVNHDTINALHWHQHPVDYDSIPSVTAEDRKRIFFLGSAWIFLGVPGRPMIFQGDQFAQSYHRKGWSDASHVVGIEERQTATSTQALAVHRALSGLLDSEPAFLRMDGASSRNLLIDSERHDVLVQVREGTRPEETIVIVQNWGAKDFLGNLRYRIPVPSAGQWEVIFNSDEPRFGGRDLHKGLTTAVAPGIFGSLAALAIDLPRYTTLVLKKVSP